MFINSHWLKTDKFYDVHVRISVDTKIYAVIGDPIAQSLSPQLHNGLLKATGVDGLYLPIGVKSEDLEKLVAGFRTVEFWRVPHHQAPQNGDYEISGSSRSPG